MPQFEILTPKAFANFSPGFEQRENPGEPEKKSLTLKGSAVGERFQRSRLISIANPGLSLRSNRGAEISERLRRNFELRH